MTGPQLLLPGCEEFFQSKPEWTPCRYTLERVTNYYLGFVAHGRSIFAKLEYMAARLKMSVRNLSRYLKHLSENGLLETIRRGRTSAIRKFSKPIVQSNVQSNFTPPLYEVTSEVKPLAAPRIDRFNEYFAVFLASGKPLSERDQWKACQMWVSYQGKERDGWEDAAIRDAIQVCSMASAVFYVPLPINHLMAKPWTRVAMPRTLQPEGKLSRMMREGMEILRRKGMA